MERGDAEAAVERNPGCGYFTGEKAAATNSLFSWRIGLPSA